MVMKGESMTLGNYMLTPVFIFLCYPLLPLICPQRATRNCNRAISVADESIVLRINSVGNQEINGIERSTTCRGTVYI